MSETGEGGEKEKKLKPGLVRLNRGSSSPSTPNAKVKLCGSTQNKTSVSLLSPLNRSSGVQSFKPKRDLTLGGGGSSSLSSIKTINSSVKPLERKKFVPNLNVTRQVKKENNGESAAAVTGGKRRKEKKFERREKNSRDRPSLIQTDSIFSEGVGGDPLRRRVGGVSYGNDGGGGGGPEASALIKPKLELGKPCDRAEEDRKLKLLLNDDFIDDLKHGNFLPIQLPMIDSGKIFKSEVKQEETDEIKPRLLNKKVSELDSDDDDDLDPSTQQQPPPVIQQQPSDHLNLPHVADILNQAGSQLIFFQLPDNLPVRMSADVAQSTDGTLTGVEGRLGEISIRKSGNCQLILGDSKQGDQRFDIEAGTQVGFLQDLVSIRVPPLSEQDGEMTVLGHISNRLIISPNWDSLLQDSGFDRDLA